MLTRDGLGLKVMARAGLGRGSGQVLRTRAGPRYWPAYEHPQMHFSIEDMPQFYLHGGLEFRYFLSHTQ